MNGLELIKYPLRVVRNRARRLSANIKTRRTVAASSFDVAVFDPARFKSDVIGFLARMRHQGVATYRYSATASEPTLYASAYACMTLSLLGEIQAYSQDDKSAWLSYFDSFQSEADGLFYDPVVDSELFRTQDWWGARHLALHMISAYTALGGRPKYPFRFVAPYCDVSRIESWLEGFRWDKSFAHTEDIDNKIMNIGCLLQYQRDAWQDEKAGVAVAFLREYLAQRVNPETGMWGRFDVDDPDERSRMVQFAYHLFPLYFYDSIPIAHPEKVVEHTLATQNELGGFGVSLNASACEDVDSVDILVRLAHLVPARKAQIDTALSKAFRWLLCNQVGDGGFVFRLYEPMIYGHQEMANRSNSGAMFPTWFRILTLAYLARHFSIDGFRITRAPGLEH